MKCLLLLGITLLSSSYAQESQILKEFLTGYNRFTADIYKELLKSNSDNFLVCPLSAYIVFALTRSLVQDTTAKELEAVLHLPTNSEKVHQMFKAVLPHLQSSKNYNLSSANKVYVKKNLKIVDDIKKMAEDVFRVEIQNIDFSKSQEAANEINQWVEDKTFDKIKDLISPDLLSDATFTILTNAMHFQGEWIEKLLLFKQYASTFYVNKKDTRKIGMMFLGARLQYYNSSKLNAQFLKLDYESGDVSMHIVLPNQVDGLDALEETISEVLIPPEYTQEAIQAQLPKFKIETKVELIPILQALGVKTAFEKSATVQGIEAELKNLKISEVVQKGIIEVGEGGTNTEVVTDVEEPYYFEGDCYEFVADHPFLFYLRLNQLGVNFFVGRYVSP